MSAGSKERMARIRHQRLHATPSPNAETPQGVRRRFGVDETEVETEFEEEQNSDADGGRRVRTDPGTPGDSHMTFASGYGEAQGAAAPSAPPMLLKKSQEYSSSSSKSLPPLESQKPLEQRIRQMRTRAVWSFVLMFGFSLIFGAGHFYCSCLVLLLTVAIYQEVSSLRQNDEKENRLPLFIFLRWYWFSVSVFATGTVWLFPLLVRLSGRLSFVDPLISHHAIVSYIAAFFGLILFILSLRRFSLRYQFSKFALLLLTCIFVVAQSMFQIANIYNGLIWFFLSCTSVVVNDVSAYMFGVFFGRTRLIKLSPKKTLEGYLGACVTTILWALLLSSVLPMFPVFYCPEEKIVFEPFAMWHRDACEVPATFVSRDYHFPETFARYTGITTIRAMPMHFHGLVIGLFAGFFAPFGGFFASGLKRALRIKDFASIIPGHGGFTDRFDCQIMMGMFTYLYVRTFVLRRFGVPTVESIMKSVAKLSVGDQKFLLRELQELLGPALPMTEGPELMIDS